MKPSDHGHAIRLLQGDSATITLVRNWIRGAFTPYRSRLGTDLEDLEQEILLDLTVTLRKEGFRGESQFHTFVNTFVHHKCIDRLRAQRRREWVDIEQLDLASTAPSALERLTTSEGADIALRTLNEMPASCRELWQMLFEGQRYSQMSQQLGISEGTLRARVLRCRRRALDVRNRLLAGRQ
jgi:RNA polymerase sigma factor (sigma-70 family)